MQNSVVSIPLWPKYTDHAWLKECELGQAKRGLMVIFEI